jgi:hypothetical protein
MSKVLQRPSVFLEERKALKENGPRDARDSENEKQIPNSSVVTSV